MASRFQALVAVLALFVGSGIASAQVSPTGTWANETGGQQFQYGTAASDGTYLYVFGGYQYGVSYNYPQYYQACARYDPVNNYWSTMAFLPVPQYYCAGSYSNGRVFCFGGYNPTTGQYFNRIDAYSVAANTWTTLSATLTTTRYLLAAAATSTDLGERIYITGGYYNGYTNQNDEFNPSTDTVTARATMPYGLYQHTMAGVPALGKVYALCGYNSQNSQLSAVCYEFTPPTTASGTGSWATKAPMVNSGGTQQARYSPVAMSLGNRVYVIGGNSTNQNYEYNPLTDTWTQRASCTYNRYYFGGAAIANKGYIYGGPSASTQCEEFTPPSFGLPPNAPTNVNQTGSQAGSALQAQTDPMVPDGWTNNLISFSANVTDPDAGQQVRLRVQVKSASAPTWAGAATIDSGLTNQGLITVNYTIPTGGDFDWRYRVEDTYANSYPATPGTWVEAFGNASSPDFRSDQVPPADPLAQNPSNVDVEAGHPVEGPVVLHWTESTDNGPTSGISYELQVAREGGFIDIEAQIFSSAGTSAYPVTLSVARTNKFWRVRAKDIGGNLSAWSPSLTFRVVYDDKLDHGAGDAKKSCGFGATAAAPSVALALLALALIGLGFGRRPALK
ncbi:MAG TPA: kelch repeat-containing protein [Planctomycetota bacterium]|nr:kelch repeat-containing protein [Planctomycetota bacterium]